MSIKVFALLLFVSFLLTCLDPILAERDFREERRIISRNEEFNRLIEEKHGSSLRRERYALERDNEEKSDYRRYVEREERKENSRRNNHENERILQRMNDHRNDFNRQDVNRRIEIVRVSFDSLQRERFLQNDKSRVGISNIRGLTDNPNERIETFPLMNFRERFEVYSVDRNDKSRMSHRESMKFNDANLRYQKRINTENYEDTLNEMSEIKPKVLDRLYESEHIDMRNNARDEARRDSRKEQDQFVGESVEEKLNGKYRNRKQSIKTNVIGERIDLSNVRDFDRRYRIDNSQENNRHSLNFKRDERRLDNSRLNTEKTYVRQAKLEPLVSLLSEQDKPMENKESFIFLIQSSFIAILVFKIIGDCEKIQKHWATASIRGVLNPIGF